MFASASRRHMSYSFDVDGGEPRLAEMVLIMWMAAAISRRTRQIADCISYGPSLQRRRCIRKLELRSEISCAFPNQEGTPPSLRDSIIGRIQQLQMEEIV